MVYMSKKKYLLNLIILLTFINFNDTHAEMNIEVMALFKNKAILNINNEQQLFIVGEPEKLGVKLIQATSKFAVLEINGKRSKYNLGNRVQADYSSRDKKDILVYPDNNGMYRTIGSINGYTVDFLVDTGASAIALNSNTAKRIGLRYKLEGDPIYITTASGKEAAYSINLDRVKVGEIILRNVHAVVIDGNEPSTTLLGMSYLERLNIVNEGQVMKLEQKF